MITGEFLVADDLAQAGRLVAPGESLILRSGDRQLLPNEMEWIKGKLKEADRLLVKLCKLVPWRENEELDRIFDAMINWSAEAVKYGVMLPYLTEVDSELARKGKVDIFVRSRFRWTDYPVISDFIDFLKVVRVEQLKKFLEYAFTNEEMKQDPARIYLAAAQMSASMRKQRD